MGRMREGKRGYGREGKARGEWREGRGRGGE